MARAVIQLKGQIKLAANTIVWVRVKDGHAINYVFQLEDHMIVGPITVLTLTMLKHTKKGRLGYCRFFRITVQKFCSIGLAVSTIATVSVYALQLFVFQIHTKIKSV